jgi:hypothetical protein
MDQMLILNISPKSRNNFIMHNNNKNKNKIVLGQYSVISSIIMVQINKSKIFL